MTPETHSQLANFIWSICNLLRGPYKRNEYRKVILPLTVLRRFDCLLAPTKAKVLERHAAIKAKPESVVRSLLEKITGRPFFNLSKLDIPKLLDDPNQLAPNLNGYINGFSKNVREIMERLIKTVLNAIGERDETAEVCLDKNDTLSLTRNSGTRKACHSRNPSRRTSGARCFLTCRMRGSITARPK
ncbi:MAG: type I restriction-modification system subunit M N-terminal domain-containing protein [Desulfobacterales bacterium]|nr:type I restriction-modification system subunit M N-terminal domain-containing protein [Desulfobacterales bacterium]